MKNQLLKQVIKNCIPTILSLAMMGLYAIVDGLFIGNATGDVGLAAINIAWPLIAVINAIGVTIGTAGSVLMSFEKGRGDEQKSTEYYRITISLIIVVSLLTTIILLPIFPKILALLGAEGEVYTEAYNYTQVVILGCLFQSLGSGLVPILRNKDKAFTAMICMGVGVALNIGVNYYLIFVLGLGIRGAAIATIFAQFVVAVLASVTLLKIEKYRFLLKIKELARIFKIGFVTFGSTIAPSIVLLFTNLQCLRYGGDAAVASYAVIAYISYPVQAMLTGIGEGVQPLMSRCMGENNGKMLADIKKIARVFILILGAVLTVVVALVNQYMGVWFGLSETANSFYLTGMLIYVSGFIVAGYVKFNVSYLNATLQTQKALILTYSESLVITPIYIFTLPIFFELSGIWLSFPFTAVTQILIYIVLSKIKK